ncbi:hypothetical protein GBAR_LOCUS20092 [Geodia barretti]|uniref:Uncharacterized protein n=1 Tax=Geodia barretti TaxID=519541 RepID=A0AA35STX0_GEOBA|nr:hypothetical protein GBAR_LOCUS20092 [Geodia barretti]
MSLQGALPAGSVGIWAHPLGDPRRASTSNAHPHSWTAMTRSSWSTTVSWRTTWRSRTSWWTRGTRSHLRRTAR